MLKWSEVFEKCKTSIIYILSSIFSPQNWALLCFTPGFYDSTSGNRWVYNDNNWCCLFSLSLSLSLSHSHTHTHTHTTEWTSLFSPNPLSLWIPPAHFGFTKSSFCKVFSWSTGDILLDTIISKGLDSCHPDIVQWSVASLQGKTCFSVWCSYKGWSAWVQCVRVPVW